MHFLGAWGRENKIKLAYHYVVILGDKQKSRGDLAKPLLARMVSR